MEHEASSRTMKAGCSSGGLMVSRRCETSGDAEPVIGLRYARSGTSCREDEKLCPSTSLRAQRSNPSHLAKEEWIASSLRSAMTSCMTSLLTLLGGRRIAVTAGAAEDAKSTVSPHEQCPSCRYPIPPRSWSGDARSTHPLQGRDVGPHNSRAFENANELTRRVFSSKISVRVIGGSARWLQFSRSQSRQLTPIGVPSAFSRSIPAA